jgi:formate dehydrogenase subunit delta
MKIERLIKMANDISNFFASEPDQAVAIDGIRNHLQRAWEPRMRSAIIAYCQEDGAALSDLARAAVAKLS